MEYQYKNYTIAFEIIYSKRKTMEISIKPPGIIKVKAPRRLSEEQIIQWVKSKSEWIAKKTSEFKDIEHMLRKKEYINGEKFMYLGEEYPLEIIIDKSLAKSKVKNLNDKFYIHTSIREEYIMNDAMEQWYRERTEEIILEKIKYYEKYFNVVPNKIKIKEQKRIWGSCSSKKNLNFNWRLSMAPISVIEYIVVHEMCHLIHMNHSKKFWNLVGDIMPNYKEKREWLKKYSATIML
ncbi:M48 family metallopeptidase [Clostridium sp. D2Q-11]|uniref:M48 family metallopeptidase n=1 Tax=Anaeromonas frigoriresistens TaxID=2683708 RepID=A0A942UXA6_9FIRM|nr:SprT family zinc-dependent metalloprotease [Anaeromonas frigoriresistens]MBS4538646.1 M48 family metallopeptidase [Anaeromonas frigoriresistens]